MTGNGLKDKDIVWHIVAGPRKQSTDQTQLPSTSTMATHHSADARTAFMATYIARYTNPRAGTQFTRATPCSPQPMEVDTERGRMGSRDAFGARGRTIYNADAYPINRGHEETKWDAFREKADEEERQRQHWNQFLIVARGDFEEEERMSSSSSSSSPTMSGAELAAAEEMFARYIRDV